MYLWCVVLQLCSAPVSLEKTALERLKSSKFLTLHHATRNPAPRKPHHANRTTHLAPFTTQPATTHHAPRTTHHATRTPTPRNPHHAPRTTHLATRTPQPAPRTLYPLPLTLYSKLNIHPQFMPRLMQPHMPQTLVVQAHIFVIHTATHPRNVEAVVRNS